VVPIGFGSSPPRAADVAVGHAHDAHERNSEYQQQ
jgi:hypothetical protein